MNEIARDPLEHYKKLGKDPNDDHHHVQEGLILLFESRLKHYRCAPIGPNTKSDIEAVLMSFMREMYSKGYFHGENPDDPWIYIICTKCGKRNHAPVLTSVNVSPFTGQITVRVYPDTCWYGIDEVPSTPVCGECVEKYARGEEKEKNNGRNSES